MEDFFQHFSGDLLDRLRGPLRYRVYLQPLVATIFAILSGLRDSRQGNGPFIQAIFSQAGERLELLKCGWRSIWRVFVMAVLIDWAYQYFLVERFSPGAALVTAFILAIIPYVIIRTEVNRIATFFRRRRASKRVE